MGLGHAYYSLWYVKAGRGGFWGKLALLMIGVLLHRGSYGVI